MYSLARPFGQEKEKTMMRFSSRHLAIIGVVGLLFSVALFFRYEIQPKANGFGVFVLDRWTGTVTSCNAQSC